jgi:hypothetical protein
VSTYGTPEGVRALTRHMGIDGPRAPTSEQINDWLNQASAELTGMLVDAGYGVPVTQETAAIVLNGFANVRVAALAELAQRFAGDTDSEGNKRYEAFLAEWNKAAAWITSGQLAALGVAQGALPEQTPAIGQITVGTLLDTARTLPLEWR